MSKVINAEVTTTELLEPKDIISIEKIEQGGLEQFKQYNKQIQAELTKLKLDEIIKNASEDNLKLVKTTRTTVRKSKKDNEDRRKLVEKQYTEPLDKWKENYKKYAFEPLDQADKDLKKVVDKIEDDLRKEKTDTFVKEFKALKEEHKIDFVKFEDVGLNIQLSTSNTALSEELKDFFEKVTNDLAVIETTNNKERVLVKYMQDLDLSNAIVTVDREIKQEEELKAKQEAQLQAMQETLNQAETLQEDLEKVDLEFKPKEVEKVVPVEPKLITMSFTVTGTKEQLIAVREFMKGQGIQYV